MMPASRITNGFVWSAFAVALVLATRRLWFFGFNPTVDELLQLAICGGALR